MTGELGAPAFSNLLTASTWQPSGIRDRLEELFGAAGAFGGRLTDIFAPDFLERLKALYDDLDADAPHVEDITSMLKARNTRGQGDQLIVEDQE